MALVKIDAKNFYAQSDCMKEMIFSRIKKPHTISITKKEFNPDKALIIEGFGNVSVPDRGGEIMPKECWDLTNYLKNPVICRDHCWGKLIGVAQAIEPRDEGLFLRSVIGDPSVGFGLTKDQEEARSLVAQGYLKAHSVGFIPWAMTYDEEQDLIIYEKAELLEVSLVTIPMQQDSMFEVVKSKLLRNSPLTIIGGNEMSVGKNVKGEAEGQENNEDENEPMMNIVNKMSEELQNNSRMTSEIHAKVCGSSEDKKLLDEANEEIKKLKEQLETATTELNNMKSEKEELEKSLEELLKVVEFNS